MQQLTDRIGDHLSMIAQLPLVAEVSTSIRPSENELSVNRIGDRFQYSQTAIQHTSFQSYNSYHNQVMKVNDRY